MIIDITPYPNSSLGKLVTVHYNDVTHAVTGHTLGADYPFFGLTPGSIIYTQVDGGTVYFVRVQNSGNYAYVTSEAIETCSIVIDSATPTSATNEVTANGAILIAATGNGTKSYSIDGGATWQSGTFFSGLLPGLYPVMVRNVYFNPYLGTTTTCYASEDVIVGYTALSSCDLVLGNVATSLSGGTLSVLDYSTTHLDQPVEYRLDAGAWQDSPDFSGLGAGPYNVQIRFKNFTACSSNRDVDVNDCGLVLSVDVTHEQTRYGDDGQISIGVTGGTAPYQYSIDDGDNYQAGILFEGLAPGPYDVRVLDDTGCEVFTTVTVEAYKAVEVVFPIANGMRVVITSGPPQDTGPQNFDNTLFADMKFPARVKGCYSQPYATDKIVPLQWRSGYDAHTVKVYTKAGVLHSSLTPIKRTELMNHTEELDAMFSNYGAGKTQIWFPAGLPAFFEAGQDITITDQPTLNGTYEIEEIVAGTLEALGYQVLIITATYSSGSDPITGTVSLTYNIEDYEVWEVTVDMSTLTAETEYYLLFTGTDDVFEDFTAKSEPFKPTADTDDLLLVTHKNIESAFLIDYSTGIEHVLQVEGELLPAGPGGEREVMEDSRRRLLKLRENVTRLVQFNVFDVPYWMVEKIKVAMAHDILKVNGVEYQPVEDMNMELPNPLDNLCNCSVKLRQVDFIAENSDDAGDVDKIIEGLDNGPFVMGLNP